MSSHPVDHDRKASRDASAYRILVGSSSSAPKGLWNHGRSTLASGCIETVVLMFRPWSSVKYTEWAFEKFKESSDPLL